MLKIVTSEVGWRWYATEDSTAWGLIRPSLPTPLTPARSSQSQLVSLMQLVDACVKAGGIFLPSYRSYFIPFSLLSFKLLDTLFESTLYMSVSTGDAIPAQLGGLECGVRKMESSSSFSSKLSILRRLEWASLSALWPVLSSPPSTSHSDSSVMIEKLPSGLLVVPRGWSPANLL